MIEEWLGEPYVQPRLLKLRKLAEFFNDSVANVKRLYDVHDFRDAVAILEVEQEIRDGSPIKDGPKTDDDDDSDDPWEGMFD